MTGPGGPAERTTLAWTRTSFAFLVNGVLLALKDIHGAGHRLGALLPAGVACVGVTFGLDPDGLRREPPDALRTFKIELVQRGPAQAGLALAEEKREYVWRGDEQVNRSDAGP